MMPRLMIGLLVSASLGATLPARAEPPSGWKLAGEHVSLSLERVASALLWSPRDPRFERGQRLSLKPQGFDVSLLSSGAANSGSSLPRFAADYVTRHGLSLGGAIGFGYVEGDNGGELGRGAELELAIAARVGYLVPLTPGLALWPRLGVDRANYAIVHGVFSGTSGKSWHLTVDPQLAIVLAPRVVVTTGLLLEASLFPDQESPRELAGGLTVGFAAML